MSCVSPRRGRPGARGFTLVELVYAAALFEVGLLGLISFQVAAAHAVTRAHEVAMATHLATSAIEDGRAGAGAAWLAQPQPMVSYATRDGMPSSSPDFFTVSTAATQPQNVVAYYDLAVTVAWKHFVGEGITHSIAMETYVATE